MLAFTDVNETKGGTTQTGGCNLAVAGSDDEHWVFSERAIPLAWQKTQAWHLGSFSLD